MRAVVVGGGIAGRTVAGAAYRGVGIPDCIRSGEAAAESVARALAAARA
jgi:protoporphyrinogen oxidase